MPDDAGERSPSSTVAVTRGASHRQRDPAVFSGTGDTDVDDLLSVVRPREQPQPTGPMRLEAYETLSFCLADVANLWLQNHDIEALQLGLILKLLLSTRLDDRRCGIFTPNSVSGNERNSQNRT